MYIYINICQPLVDWSRVPRHVQSKEIRGWYGKLMKTTIELPRMFEEHVLLILAGVHFLLEANCKLHWRWAQSLPKRSQMQKWMAPPAFWGRGRLLPVRPSDGPLARRVRAVSYRSVYSLFAGCLAQRRR